MTFLVLLASIAILEYLVRRAEPLPRKREPIEKQKLNELDRKVAEKARESLAQSLRQLSQTIEQFGRGAIPEDGPKPVKSPDPRVGDTHSKAP